MGAIKTLKLSSNKKKYSLFKAVIKFCISSQLNPKSNTNTPVNFRANGPELSKLFLFCKYLTKIL